MAAARARLRQVGVSGAVLWALEGNTDARRFYERDGWRTDGTCRTAVFGNDTRRLVRYRIEPV